MKQSIYLSCLLAFALFMGPKGWTQTAFTATYTFGSNGDVTSFTYNGTTYTGIAPAPIMKVGVTSSSSGSNFRASGWPTAATADVNKYIGFTIAAQSGYKFTVTTINFGIGRSSTGTRTTQWRGSADTYSALLNNYTTLNSSITNTSGELANPNENSNWTGNILTLGSEYANITTSCGFRMYLYAAGATAGTAGLAGPITITGTFEPDALVPTLTVTPTTLSNFNYTVGNGPSASQSYTLSGANLSGFPGNITVTGSTNYQVSTNNSTFSNSLQVPYTTATLASTPIYVRLKSGLAVGSYNSETIASTGGGATVKNVTVSGSVSPLPIPEAPFANAATAVGATTFTANWETTANATSYEIDVYTLTGSPTTVISENFNGFTAGTSGSGADASDVSGSLNTYTQTAGWTGSKVYQAGGTAKMGSSSALGSIVSPEIDLSSASGNFSLAFEAMAWSGDATSLKIYLNDVLVQTVTGLNNSSYTLSPFSIDLSGGTANSKIKFEGQQASKGRFFLENLVVTKGATTITPISGSPFTTTETNKIISGLSPNTTYYYRVRAKNAAGTSDNSNVIATTTLAAVGLPVVSNSTATAIGETIATLGGEIISDEGFAITERGTVWATNPGVTISDNKLAEGNTATGVFSHQRTGLPAETLIYFRAYATNANGTSLSEESSFTTYASEPLTHATGFNGSNVSTTSTTITLTWTNPTPASESYLIKGVVGTGTIANPVDNVPETDALLVKNLAATAENYTFTGLTPSTTYTFKIFPYNGSGSNLNYLVTNAPQTSATTTALQPRAKIFISEYIEGNSNNKAIEIVNKEATPINLALLHVRNYSNGSATISTQLNTLSGTLAPGQVFVVAYSGAAADFLSYANHTGSAVTNFNGDDALEIVYDGQVTDVFGTIGTDPGTAWSVGGVADATVNKTLIRKLSVTQGNTINAGSFGTDLENTEWIIKDIDYSANLGAYGSAFTGAVGSDWSNTANWDMGIPTESVAAIIPIAANNPLLSTEKTVANLLVKEGGSLSISGRLTVSEKLTNNAGTSGMIIKSSGSGTGSLLHNSNNVSATVERYITGNTVLTAFDYHLVSIPLNTNVTTAQFAGAYLYQFNTASQQWETMGTSTTTPLWNNQGFMIYYPNSSHTYNFEGELNNGTFSLSTPLSSADQFALVPNPYPSAIDWDQASGWTKMNFYDAIWIWDPVANQYATYGANIGVNGATHDIPAGQAFFVKSNGGSAFLSVNNAARLHSGQHFFKEGSNLEKDVLRIHAHANNLKDEIAIRFTRNAEAAFDTKDVDKLFGADIAPQLYSLTSDNRQLAINSLPYSAETMVVPMGFEITGDETVSFTLEGIESFEPTVGILLEDVVLNQWINLREQNTYTFQHLTNENPQRFLLHFMGVTATGEQAAAETGQIWNVGSKLYFSFPERQNERAELEIYDVLGRKIDSQSLTLGAATVVSTSYNGIAFVQLRVSTQVYSKKVFIQQ